jgi:hypothetical protein
MHHHHTLNGTVYHDHPESFHDTKRRHPDKADWSPAHYGHDHPEDGYEVVGRTEPTPHSWIGRSVSNVGPMWDIRTEYWPYP